MVLLREQHILTDDEIANIIIKYIDEKIYNYAIMIDGEWGCGKTYFIKEYLVDKIEKHEAEKVAKTKSARETGAERYKERKIIYISLYGIKSTDEISQQILMESVFKLAKDKKGKNIIQAGTKLGGAALTLLSSFGIEFNADDFSNKVAELVPVKESILIFDDLERCDCPINEILGYVNTFVEQDGLKVILVANQREIGRSTYQANQELKYLVAAHPHIMFSENADNKILKSYITGSNKDKESNEPVNQIDLNTIHDRIDRLFNQNISYEQIKEKLVGQTIYYYPNLQAVFEKMITSSPLEDSLKSTLLERTTLFKEYMIGEGHPNLRTFQFFLSKIQDLYRVIDQINDESQDTGKEAFLSYIINYCFRICVSYKSGTYKYDWSKNEEYEQKGIGQVDIFRTSLCFRFVDDFIVNSILDKDSAERMLRVYKGMYCEQPDIETKSLNLIQYDWATSSDKELEKAIAVVIQGLKDDKFKTTSYSPIIGALLILEDIGFSATYWQDAISLMKANIYKLTYRVGIDTGYRIDENTDIGKRHQEIIKDLQAQVDNHFKQQTASQIEQHLLMKDGWAGKLVDYLKDNQFEIIHTVGFLSQVDINKLLDKLANATSYDINAFRICINSLYRENSIGAALNQEGQMLADLIEGIKKFDTSTYDKIKHLQISCLIKNLESAQALYTDEKNLEVEN